MKKIEILKLQRSKILAKLRGKSIIKKEKISEVQASSVKIISNFDIEPLEGWPSMFDRSLLPPFPTDVQRFSIPYILRKESVSVISETGSGKTLSYVLPYVHILGGEDTRLLVVVPTRELVAQVSQLFRRFSLGSLKIIQITGGKNIDLQRLELSNSFNVIISTPGRLIELMQLKCVGNFDYAIIDEVDRLLSCNFKEDIKCILECANAKVLSYFSATLFECSTRTRILVGDVCVNKNIEEHFLYTEKNNKTRFLKRILESPQGLSLNGVIKVRNENVSSDSMEDIKKIIIFCNTIKACEALHMHFKGSKILHSRKNMIERESIIEDMHNTEGVLITTDLAGRGIDIKDVDLVINYDFPTSIETYIHRCGRTGRQKCGRSLSILCEDDRNMFGKLKRLIEERDRIAPEFLAVKDEFIVN